MGLHFSMLKCPRLKGEWLAVGEKPRIPANLRIPPTEHAACFATGERNNLSAGEVVGRM